jgi:hypothetical protein
MNNPGLTKNFKIDALVPPYRIVTFGVDAFHVVLPALATDPLIGVTDAVVPVAPLVASSAVDVVMDKITQVEFGGVVTAGDLLTADATGRAIKALPAVGANMRIIGMAVESGVLGDIGALIINQSQIQG